MIVASDLEGTLTTGETWKALGRYLRSHGQGRAYNAFFGARLPRGLAAKAGLIDMLAFRDRWIAELPALLSGLTEEAWNDVAEWVIEQELWPKRREAVLQELRRHQEAGRRVVLASSTYQPVLEAFARRIGAEALGTPLELLDGKATGRVVAPVNSGQAKAQRLVDWCGTQKLHTAYGDTLADVPMLALAETGVVVHPAPALQKVAQARGWRTLTAESGG
jgi:phosphoserine phosphatase